MALPNTFTVGDDATAEDERARLQELAQFLARQDASAPKLVFPQGQEARLPELAYRVLRDAVRTLAEGDAVSLVPLQQTLTPQEAAGLLGVSQDAILRLLDEGTLPFHTADARRRIVHTDLLAYQRTRKARRRAALRELTRLSEELGLYDR